MNHCLFERTFGISLHDIQDCLDTALSQGSDYADLYLEHLTSSAIIADDGVIKTASSSTSVGCGVRAIAGERTGYAYTCDLELPKIKDAARIASYIASGKQRLCVRSLTEPPEKRLYPDSCSSPQSNIALRSELVLRADRAARKYGSSIANVRSGYTEERKEILIAGSDGTYARDSQPLARISVDCVARSSTRHGRGRSGGGGRVGGAFFARQRRPEYYAEDAARQAMLQMNAHEAPTGEMQVVLGPGWPGILLHEAVGHGLEADLNRRQASVFHGRVGTRVGSSLCTIVDDGTLPFRRGSINVDDEGSPSGINVLIENGILQGYLTDRLSAKLMGLAATGNGRRESYQHVPLPRMTNTYMLPGSDHPEEIIRSVRRGIYAINFSGGQVEYTSGNFVFTASESYLIENGRVTAPLRNCSLIGNGPQALTKVSMVGNDLAFDEGVGTCGKDGQALPVGVGIPTIKIDEMTVGGTTLGQPA
jgi:TldD protein